MENRLTLICRLLSAAWIVVGSSRGSLTESGDYKFSDGIRYRFQPLKQYVHTRTYIKHMEALITDKNYLLFLDNRGLKTTNGRLTESIWFEVTNNNNKFLSDHGVRLSVPNNFHQLSRSQTVLVYEGIYCIFILKHNGSVNLQKSIGRCNSSGVVDGSGNLVQFGAIRSVSSTYDAQLVYILDTENRVRLFNYTADTVETLSNEGPAGVNPVIVTQGSKIVYAIKNGFFTSGSATSNVSSQFTFIGNPKHEGVAVEENVYAIVDQYQYVVIINGITGQMFPICQIPHVRDETDHFFCTRAEPSSVLYHGGYLYMGGAGYIYSLKVTRIDRCTTDGKWVSRNSSTIKHSYRENHPLTTGVYRFSTTLNQSDCSWYLEISNVSQSLRRRVSRCDIEDSIDIHDGNYATNITLDYNVTVPASAGTYVFLEHSGSICERKITVEGNYTYNTETTAHRTSTTSRRPTRADNGGNEEEEVDLEANYVRYLLPLGIGFGCIVLAVGLFASLFACRLYKQKKNKERAVTPKIKHDRKLQIQSRSPRLKGNLPGKNTH